MIYHKPFTDAVKMELYLQLWPPAVDDNVIALIPAVTEEDCLIVEGKPYFALCMSMNDYHNVLTGGGHEEVAPQVRFNHPVEEIDHMTKENNIVKIVKRIGT